MRFAFMSLGWLFLMNFTSFSQTITGTLSDSDGSSVYSANILFKEKAEPTILKEFVIVRNGKFNFTLKKTYRDLLIEVKTPNYYPLIKQLDSVGLNQIYTLDFILVKKDTIDLEEVTITAKKLPFEIKEDTISFNVAAYLDGSERKIQEVIQKLPGVELNEKTGEIKYHGKSVETVTLDGENLFGYNYSIGTKNINVDMVEQVQAIDNYSENSLLKGIEQGGKVALNLKLKKGKFDFSGSLDNSLGVFAGKKAARSGQATLLGVTNRYKSFGSASHNNVGINDSPFDYFGFSQGIEQSKERESYADKILPELRFFSPLGDKRANINNQNFGNYNAIFKINRRLSVKTNLYAIKDNIKANQLFENKYLFNNQSFTTYDDTQLNKRPTQYRGDIELKYNLNSKSLVEYEFRIRQEAIQSVSSTTSNGNRSFESVLTTKDFFQKQRLLFTKKFNPTQVIQFLAVQTHNYAPQLYELMLNTTESSPNRIVQQSSIKKKYVDIKANLLGKNKLGKYNFSGGFSSIDVLIKSSQKASQLVSESLVLNNSIYSRHQIYATGFYQIQMGKILFSPSHRITYYSQDLALVNSSNLIKKNNFAFEPTANFRLKITDITSVNLKAGRTQNPFSEKYMFTNFVQIDNRTTIANAPSLEMQKENSIRLGFLQNDLFNQFYLDCSVAYRQNNGDFFTNFSVNERTTNILYFFLPQNNNDLTTDFLVSKYISILGSTIKFSSNYNIATYQNSVNGSALRSNQIKSLSTELFWKTAFHIPFNFENIIKLQSMKAKNLGSDMELMNNAVQNVSRLFIKPIEKYFIIFTSEIYLPNWSNRKEKFTFFDVAIRSQSRKKSLEYTATFKNITNTPNFEQVLTTDISANVFRSNLLPRYFMIALTYSF